MARFERSCRGGLDAKGSNRTPRNDRRAVLNDPNDGNTLVVDYSWTPAKYTGVGIKQVELTVNCPSSDPTKIQVGLYWFSGSGELSADGSSMDGSGSNEYGTSSYHLGRP